MWFARLSHYLWFDRLAADNLPNDFSFTARAVAAISACITQVVGLLGTLTCALTIDYVGRRPWFSAAFAGAAIALGALWFIGATSAERVLVLVSTAFFFSSVLSIGVYLYTPELYPTRARAMGVGVATAWLRLASMIGPSVVGLMIGGGLDNVFLAFGLIAAIAAVVTALFAVETKGRVLEEVSP